MEIVVNKNDCEVILLKEDPKAERCKFFIDLIKEGLLMEDVNENDVGLDFSFANKQNRIVLGWFIRRHEDI